MARYRFGRSLRLPEGMRHLTLGCISNCGPAHDARRRRRMSHSNERGAAERGLRSSALWGTGSRGGDSRSSVLWGKGGRGIFVTCIAVFALAAPLAATAAPSAHSVTGSSAAPTSTRSLLAGGKDGKRTYIARDLLDKAKRSPAEKVRVIIQSSAGVSGADSAYKGLGFAGR